MADPMLAELLKRAATENAQLVDPPAPVAQPAPKQGLSAIAKALYAGGAGADIGSTLASFTTGKMHENNPLVNFAGDKAALPIGVGEELGVYLLAKKLFGDRHPALMNLLVGGAGIAHSAFAARNIERMRAESNQPTLPISRPFDTSK